MSKLENLTHKELMNLYKKCNPKDEKIISDEVFRRYGVELEYKSGSDWGYLVRLIILAVVSFVGGFFIARDIYL